MKVDTNQLLRDSVHDIIVGLKSKQKLTVQELCAKLSEEYRINIFHKLLGAILTRWKTKSDRTFFARKDEKWLDYDEKTGSVSNANISRESALAKSRRRMEKEDKEKKKVKKTKPGTTTAPDEPEEDNVSVNKKLVWDPFTKKMKLVEIKTPISSMKPNIKTKGIPIVYNEVDKKYEPQCTYIFSEEVLKGTFADIKFAQISEMEMRIKKIIEEGKKGESYREYYDAMIQAGEDLGLTFTSDYKQFEPEFIIEKINKKASEPAPAVPKTGDGNVGSIKSITLAGYNEGRPIPLVYEDGQYEPKPELAWANCVIQAVFETYDFGQEHYDEVRRCMKEHITKNQIVYRYAQYYALMKNCALSLWGADLKISKNRYYPKSIIQRVNSTR